MVIVKVLETDRADALSIENDTAVNVRIFNVNNYRQADLFMEIKQI